MSAAAFAWLHHPWNRAEALERRQLGLLVGTVGFDLANLLFLAPKTLKVRCSYRAVPFNDEWCKYDISVGNSVGSTARLLGRQQLL
jgi:hypothetical protein